MTYRQEEYRQFGNINDVALEVFLRADPDGDRSAPASSVGSWGAWRLWVGGNNLCRFTFYSHGVREELDEVRWYLAPLFRWLLTNAEPLLHESRLPMPPSHFHLSARSEYLSQLQRFGDDYRFACWQNWAQRHAVRSCSEGGIVPDVFFQRVGDEMEISWGNRIAPGAEDALFVIEPGVARTSVDAFAEVVKDASDWFLAQQTIKEQPWLKTLQTLGTQWTENTPQSRLSWFLDSAPIPGHLYKLLEKAYPQTESWIKAQQGKPYLSPLAPQVAMFGALSPQLSEESATRLIGVLIEAKTNKAESAAMDSIVEEIPAWVSASPWDTGYQLAREVSEEMESDSVLPYTDLDSFIIRLGVRVVATSLGKEGPRGVAIAGLHYTPTVVVNEDSISNSRSSGERFTIAHELCHLFFDRDKAKSIFHASTPWSHPAVEQRANAFAAMLLMPPSRITLDVATGHALLDAVTKKAEELRVSKTALVYHLANLGEIDDQVRDELLVELQK